jgi:transcriptional regulator of arginine metabolism
MSAKTDRLQQIKEIINTNKIHKQEDLLYLLVNRGFDTTQATLSRDLRELKVGKIHDAHFGSIYFIPEQIISEESDHEARIHGLVSLEFSANLAVLKTDAGFANSVAVKLDEKNIPELLGTIAGNDAVLLIMKEGLSRDKKIKILTSYFPQLLEILI